MYFILIPLIFFPIISGMIMFYGKTVYHGLAFLGFYIIGSSFLIAISILFQLLYTLDVYLIWKKGIWPLVYEFKYSRHDEIKEMHAIYEVQFPLFHAQIMMIGLLLVAYLVGIALTKRRISSRNLFINYQVPFNIIFLYYSFFMLKGVRDEKHYIMFIVIVSCLRVHFLLYACLCWIVLALSTWNTIRCHKNFGNFMAFYVRYEPSPKSDRKLVIRESSSMAPPPEFKSDRKLVKRESSSMAKHIHTSSKLSED
ncbi:unnamed protein product [Rhizophagus irregularis]|nr:unnamed protein product [Rhizophagus irregularis]